MAKTKKSNAARRERKRRERASQGIQRAIKARLEVADKHESEDPHHHFREEPPEDAARDHVAQKVHAGDDS